MAQFLESVEEDVPHAEAMYQTTKNAITKEKVKMIMPDTLEKAKDARSIGTAALSAPNAIRSKEWLEENGICVDNIRAGDSTIPQAGRAAYAKRDLKKGQRIAPLPLMHMDKNKLRKFRKDLEINKELIVNYSYGHRNSSLLLFPYSPMVNFINNNVDKSKVNARLQWSSSRYHQKSWENETVEEILEREYTGLMLELVATADIQEGAEVFIDYGPRWDKAWNEHVQNWKAPPSSADFVPIHRLNMQEEIRTVEEQMINPYAKNALVICGMNTGKFVRDVRAGRTEFSWNDYPVETKSSLASHGFTTPCKVVERTEFLYRIAITGKDSKGKNGLEVFVNDVPRDAIEFVNKPYTSDYHIETAFRHEIDIPDEIFPAKWMNVKDAKEM